MKYSVRGKVREKVACASQPDLIKMLLSRFNLTPGAVIHRHRVIGTVILCLLTSVLFAGCVKSVPYQPVPQEAKFSQSTMNAPTSSITIWQARKAVITGLQHVVPSAWLLSVPSKIKINAESIDFYASVKPSGGSDPNDFKCNVPGLPSGSTYTVDLKRIGTFTLAGPRIAGYMFRRDPGTGLLVDGQEPFFAQTRCCSRYDVSCSPDENTRIWGILFWRTREETQSFANAMNHLRSVARGESKGGQDAVWRDFQQKAATWRALSSKPPIPEEVRQHRLLAENALREKDLDTAIGEYEDGLTIFPVWAEGHFNAALLSAELGYYFEAIRHMRAYLDLVPKATDAQSARDQIIIWEAKLTKAR
jgi:hypothetical protein